MSLLDLAKKKFAPRELTAAEVELFTKTEKGEPASKLSADDKENDPAKATTWPEDRVVHAECLAWLCTDREASALITHRGVQLYGVKIDGNLQLEHAQIEIPFIAWQCAFAGDIFLTDARMQSLSLLNCVVKNLNAENVEFKGNVHLRDRFTANGAVSFGGAVMARSLHCGGARFINPNGVALNGNNLKIEGNVFLNDGFEAQGEVNLVGARLTGFLVCNEAHFSNPKADALNVNQATIGGSVFLSPAFKANGEVNFVGATIGGSLTCIGAEFSNPARNALVIDLGKITGHIYLRGSLRMDGALTLVGAKVGGSIECEDCHFINPTRTAISAISARIDGNVFLRQRFKAQGAVNFTSATIAGSLECHSCHFSNRSGEALTATSAKVQGDVLLGHRCQADGAVNLLGATIDGVLNCEGASLLNAKGIALNANRTRLAASVFLRTGFRAKGEVNLTRATIGGNLDCSRARFVNPKGNAVVADSATIRGNVFFHNSNAKGTLNLALATIGGGLFCTNALINQAGGNALLATSAKIDGEVTLDGSFKVVGVVNFTAATIRRSLLCDGGVFSNPKSETLITNSANIDGNVFLRFGFRTDGRMNFVGAKINGGLESNGAQLSKTAVLDLRNVKVASLRDDESSWPSHPNLLLDGFSYDRIFEDSPLDANSRLRWLRRQANANFLPQPYEQLAVVLRNMGHEGAARKIMVEKNLDYAASIARELEDEPLWRKLRGRLFNQEWWWHNVFGRLNGYGYKPWRAFFISLAIILLGWGLFHSGYTNDLISPAKENVFKKDATGHVVLLKHGQHKYKLSKDYPRFNGFVYSLESFTPLLKLDQSLNWTPNANRGAPLYFWHFRFTTGSLLRSYLWFHIIVGWVLTSLWIGGLTGLVKS